jgi:hypothetical protein
MKERVIQTSPGHTASTVLVNLIYGLLEPKSAVNWGKLNLGKKLISKTHEGNIDSIMQDLKDYDLYFVMSERNDEKEQKLINQKFRKYENVLIFDYTELLETKDKSLQEICENAERKLTSFLPQAIMQQAKGGLEQMHKRISSMNEKYQEIKNKPFSYLDPFYQLHGSHRNREK